MSEPLTQTDQIPPAFLKPGGNILRPAQLVELEQDIKSSQAQLEDPRVQDKGGVRKRLADLKRQQVEQAPRELTDGAVKDRLNTRSQELLDQILPGMLSEEEMRKNPAGSVDKHMKWERANKAKILEWKKIQCLLNAENGGNPSTWDRDAANLERFRPSGPSDRLRTDAQIGGHMSYGSVPEENWKDAFGSTHPDTSALNQTKKAHATKGKE